MIFSDFINGLTIATTILHPAALELP